MRIKPSAQTGQRPLWQQFREKSQSSCCNEDNKNAAGAGALRRREVTVGTLSLTSDGGMSYLAFCTGGSLQDR